MKVLKFGGTSVANSENIRKVINIVKKKAETGKTVTVVSALSGITNQLTRCGAAAASGDLRYIEIIKTIEQKHIETAGELLSGKSLEFVNLKIESVITELKNICQGIFLLREISLRTNDYLLGFGERLSAMIISESFNSEGLNTEQVDASEMIVTDENFGNANVDLEISFSNIKELLEKTEAVNVLVNGFIASSIKKQKTTLGRGGSDYSAAIIAAATDAEALELWTDVSGVMTADPNIVETAYPLENLSYEEAMELSYFGAKIIHPPAIQPVLKKNIPKSEALFKISECKSASITPNEWSINCVVFSNISESSFTQYATTMM